MILRKLVFNRIQVTLFKMLQPGMTQDITPHMSARLTMCTGPQRFFGKIPTLHFLHAINAL